VNGAGHLNGVLGVTYLGVGEWWLVENGEEPRLVVEPVGRSLKDRKSACCKDTGTEVQSPRLY